MSNQLVPFQRTNVQMDTDCERAMSLSMQGHTASQIVGLITSERPYDYSLSMVYRDLKKGREKLAERFYERTEMMLAMELKRIEVAEEVAWSNFRAVTDGGAVTEELIDNLTAEYKDPRNDLMSEDEKERLIERTRRTITQYHSPVALGWFGKIVELQKERRRILKLYAPNNLTLIQNTREDVKVKAYMNFDPSEWRSQTVEGQVGD